MSKFIIAIDKGSASQQNAISEYLRTKKWGLWHHIEDLWLVSHAPDNLTSRELSEEICAIPAIGNHLKIVIKIPPGDATYWGDAPKKGWEWMKQYWGPPA